MTLGEARRWVLPAPASHTEMSWARMQLSMAINERPYLGKWVSGETLKQTKALNLKMQEAARVILRSTGNTTIWYYKNPPTAGNKWRLT